jgi:hypothetical protein
MSARLQIGIGLLAIAVLGTLLYRVIQNKNQTPTMDTTSINTGEILGLNVENISGIDHLVEKYLGAPGLFSLEEQLRQLKVELNPEDRWTAVPDPSLGVGSAIQIIRATPVMVIDGGTAREVFTWQTTVSELFDELSIEVDADDRVSPGQETQLKADLAITITRVGVSQEIETEDIEFRQVTQKDPNLEKGVTRLIQAGRVGLRTKTYQITRENDEIISRKLISNEITREPINSITAQGTKIITYGHGSATWYRWKQGGAAHNSLPIGTKVRVVNTSNGKSCIVTINDRGIHGGAIIDLDDDSFAELAPLGAGRINVRLEKHYP